MLPQLSGVHDHLRGTLALGQLLPDDESEEDEVDEEDEGESDQGAHWAVQIC